MTWQAVHGKQEPPFSRAWVFVKLLLQLLHLRGVERQHKQLKLWCAEAEPKWAKGIVGAIGSSNDLSELHAFSKFCLLTCALCPATRTPLCRSGVQVRIC